MRKEQSQALDQDRTKLQRLGTTARPRCLHANDRLRRLPLLETTNGRWSSRCKNGDDAPCEAENTLHPCFRQPTEMERPATAAFSGIAAANNKCSAAVTDWWARQDSNLEPRDYESPALTVVLQARRRSEIASALGRMPARSCAGKSMPTSVRGAN